MTNLTEKETKGLMIIASESVENIGQTEPKTLIEENMSYHNHKIIMRAGFSEPQAKGILSSLLEKGLSQFCDDGEFPYILTEDGINLAQELYEKEAA